MIDERALVIDMCAGLLERPNILTSTIFQSLPPTVRQDNERKLEMLKNKLDETKLKNISQKYKMVHAFW